MTVGAVVHIATFFVLALVVLSSGKYRSDGGGLAWLPSASVTRRRHRRCCCCPQHKIPHYYLSIKKVEMQSCFRFVRCPQTRTRPSLPSDTTSSTVEINNWRGGGGGLPLPLPRRSSKAELLQSVKNYRPDVFRKWIWS